MWKAIALNFLQQNWKAWNRLFLELCFFGKHFLFTRVIFNHKTKPLPSKTIEDIFTIIKHWLILFIRIFTCKIESKTMFYLAIYLSQFLLFSNSRCFSQQTFDVNSLLFSFNECVVTTMLIAMNRKYRTNNFSQITAISLFHNNLTMFKGTTIHAAKKVSSYSHAESMSCAFAMTCPDYFQAQINLLALLVLLFFICCKVNKNARTKTWVLNSNRALTHIVSPDFSMQNHAKLSMLGINTFFTS